MPPRMPFTRSPVVLLANSGTWLNQALDSVLEPLGYRVVSVGSGRELLDRAPAARPDVILMDANLQDLDSLAVCRALRQNRAVSWHTPIFMITSTPATKQQRLAALEAGAWDYLSLVLNAEELALKLDAFTRVKLETDHALDEGAVEPASGLYTMRGLVRRARPPGARAYVRRDRPAGPQRIRGPRSLDRARRRGPDGSAAHAGARNGGSQTRRPAAAVGPGRLRGRGGPARDAARARPPAGARRSGAGPGSRRGKR